MKTRSATDEMSRLRVEARKAIERIDWTPEGSFWLKLVPLIVAGLAVPEPVAAGGSRASMVLNCSERYLIREATRRSSRAGAVVLPEVGADSPVTLTVAEWIHIRAALVRAFCRISTKREQTQQEHLIVRIEDLLAGLRHPGTDTAGSPPGAGATPD